MTNQDFEKMAKKVVYAYATSHIDKIDNIKLDLEKDVYIVWICKILQNNKALLSTNLPDGMYYEVTYNGNENKLYFDAYKKYDNICIGVDGVEE